MQKRHDVRVVPERVDGWVQALVGAGALVELEPEDSLFGVAVRADVDCALDFAQVGAGGGCEAGGEAAFREEGIADGCEGWLGRGRGGSRICIARAGLGGRRRNRDLVVADNLVGDFASV